MTQVFIGVDRCPAGFVKQSPRGVSKDMLDIHHAADGFSRICNDAKAVKAFARKAAKQGAFVVFEATGRYSWPLRDALEAAGAAFRAVNPAKARHFARACGVLSKSDRVDARVLTAMGSSLALTPAAAPAASNTRARRALKLLATRRRQLVDMRKQEKTRLHETPEAFLAKRIERHIAQLSEEIARIDDRIAEATAKDEDIAAAQRLMRSVPGVGAVVATALITDLPEIGTLDRRKIAALAGLAPIARDSGRRRPRRSIGGGRPYLRSMLYLAALQASRRHPRFKAFRDRLESAGKTPKQAIIAVARKLLTILNVMIRRSETFVEKTP